MLSQDIINLTNLNHEPIIQCRICKNKSGTKINELYHTYDCRYSYDKDSFIIRYKDTDVVIAETLHRKFIYPIYQKEYYIATDEHPIIGAYDLTSCMCIIMRDPKTTKTMLAHIDQNTIEVLPTFYQEFANSNKIDLFIIGGNSESIDMCNILVNSFIDIDKYDIKFIHLIDPKLNSIGINSKTSELYANVDQSYFQCVNIRLSVEDTMKKSKLYKI